MIDWWYTLPQFVISVDSRDIFLRPGGIIRDSLEFL